jgi:hypothetical protein
MKKLSNVLLTVFVLTSFNLMAQKNAWHLFKPSTTFTNVQFSGTGFAPSLGSPFPQLKDQNNANFTDYLATNVMTDDEGKLLFTVISTVNGVYLYDINNQMVGGEPLTTDHGSKEIAIIPINRGVKYHIITASLVWEYDLSKFTVSKLNQTFPGAKIISVGNTNLLDFNIAVKLKYVNNNSDNCISGYTCYWIIANQDGGNGDRKIRKLDYRIINNGFDGVFENQVDIPIGTINSYTTGFGAYLSEMDISPDGNKLAFADDKKVFVMDLSDYSIKSLTFGDVITRRVAGLEFTPDNSKLVFSAFEPATSGGTSNDIIYLWDYPNSTPNTFSEFTSSANYARSAIETGKDGKMYVANGNGIYQLNISGLSISSATISESLYKTSDLHKYFYAPSSSLDYGIYNLPDQIDGQKTEYLTLSQTAYSTSGGRISWRKIVFVPSSGYNWSNSSHGITTKGSGKVFVLGQLEFRTTYYTSKTIVLDGLEIQFYDDAECNIYQNVLANLKGTVLKGMDCGLMWKGVDLRRSSNGSSSTKASIKMEVRNTYDESYIMDAYNGIKTIGTYGKIEILPYSTFDRNEIDISVTNISTSNLSINGALMFGETALKDQTRGAINYDDYDDLIARTTTHIEVKYSNVIIGSLTGSGNTNWMHHAQHGVKAVASSVQLYNTDMTQTRKYGLWFNANKEQNKHELTVKGCNFHTLMQAIEVEQEAKATTIQQNTFHTTWVWAIDYRGNHGGKLLIGHATDTTLKNTFIACNWSSINVWDNAKFVGMGNQMQKNLNSDIKIEGNAINNHTYANGIAIAEPVLGSRSYGLMQVNSNEIGLNQRVGQGIVLKQICGANSQLPLRYGNPTFDGNFSIRLNEIKFTTIANPFYNGILSENSIKLNFIENQINSNITSDWRNIGIKCSEGRDNLVHENTIGAGKGLQVTGNGIFSNYYCNTFNNCINGIQLGFNILRNRANLITPHNDYRIHAHITTGINPIFGRPNVFNNTFLWGSDIDVHNNTIPFNQWDFTLINSKIPIISITYPNPPGLTIKHRVNRYNPCYETFELPPLNPFNILDYDSLSDSILKWKLKYSINRYNQEGLTAQWVDDANIIAIQKMEDSIQVQSYAGAKAILDNFTPILAIDSAFKTVFSIWINNRLTLDTAWLGQNVLLNDTAWTDSANYTVQSIYIDTVSYSLHYKPLTDNEVEILTNIAELDATLINPAAYPARAILWGERHLQFSDPAIPFYPNIVGYVLAPCGGGSDTGVVIKLYDSLGVFTGIKTETQDSGFFIIEGTKLNTLSLGMKYYISAMLSNGTVSTDKATYTQLALQSYHMFDCTEPLNKRTIKKNTPLKKEAIIIHPNPSSVGFTFSPMPENWSISIIDIVGKIILVKQGSGNINIETGVLPQGIYTATIVNTNTNEKITKKLLVH